MRMSEGGKRKWVIVLVFLVFAALITIDYTQKLNKLSPYGYEKTEMAKECQLSGLEPGEVITQEIPYSEETEGISVLLSVYERGVGGTLVMKATGNRSGKTLAEGRYEISQLVAENRADLLLQEKPEAEDDAILLTITTEGDGAPLMTAWATKEDALPEATLTRQGEEQAGDLVFQRIIRTPGRYTYVTVVYCLMMAVMIGGLVLLTRKGGKAETIVFALAVAIGMLYMLVMTPLSIPDEQVHYQASYRLSSVMMFQKDKMDSGERVYFDYHGLGGHYNMGSGYDRIAEEITSPKAEISGTRKLSQRLDYPLMYVPQAIGITIGRIFGANFIILFWLGRLMNLLFYAALLYFAVKTTPKFGVLLSLVGLMPMALHQAASYSYDAFINGMALLLIALMMRATERKGRMEAREYLQILAVGMLMSPAKAVYTPMLALLLFIPKERFGSGKRKMLMICYIWAASLAAVAVFQLGGIRNAMTSGGGDTNWEGNANYTLGYLVSHPGETARLFAGSLRANLTEWPYQAIGNRLSGLSMEVTGWKITVYAVLLCLASQTAKGNETQVTGRERAAYLLVSAAVVFLVMLTMLLNWTSQNDTMIQGIQGRYFIPIVPLLLMCLNNRMIRLNINPERILLTGALAIHLAVLSGVMRMTVLV